MKKLLITLMLIFTLCLSAFTLSACDKGYTKSETDNLIADIQLTITENKTELDQMIATLTEEYSAKNAELLAKITANEQAIADLDAKCLAEVEKLQGDIATLTEQLEANKNDLQSKIDGLKAVYDSKFEELYEIIETLQTTDISQQEIIEELVERIVKLENSMQIEEIGITENGDIIIYFTDGTSKTIKKPAHEHTEGDWIIDRQSTCKDFGLKHKKCTICNAIISVDFVTDLANHTFVYGECEDCGAIDSTYMTEGLRYSLINSNQEYRVTGYVGVETDVIIPSVYKGKTVTEIGDSAFYNCDSLTSIEIPDSVTSIGKDAFYNCPIEKATIPTIAISSIPTGALKEVIITSGESIASSAFSNCNSLTSIEIPSSVISIGDEAFYDCDSLTSVEIPNSVISIGSSSFENCNSLTKVNYLGTIDQWVKIEFDGYFSNPIYYTKKLYINNELVTDIVLTTATKINDYTFYNCASLTSITISDSVTSIGYSAFHNCNSLTKVNYLGTIDQWVKIEFDGYFSNPIYYTKKLYINNELETDIVLTTATKINDYTFYNCDSLTSVEITASVTSIGTSAFAGCDSLQSVTFGENSQLTSIGMRAFSVCDSLTSIEIPDSVTSIGKDAFYNCSLLENIVVSEENAVYHSRDNCLIETATNTLIWGCTKSVIPNYVTSIGMRAFSGCSSLISIEIPNSVTSIGAVAFEDCTSLQSIEIPSSVTSIQSYAFSGCTSLQSIVIPDSVIAMTFSLFRGCSSLKTIYCEAKSQPRGWYHYWDDDCNAEVVWGHVHTSVNASCVEKTVCEACGLEYILEHTYSDFIITKTHHWKEATCGCDLKQSYGEHTHSTYCYVCNNIVGVEERYESGEFIIEKTTGKIYKANVNNELIPYDATSYLLGTTKITIGDVEQTLISTKEFTIDTAGLEALVDGKECVIVAGEKYLVVKVVTKVLSKIEDFFNDVDGDGIGDVATANYIFKLDCVKNASDGNYTTKTKVDGYYVLGANIDLLGNRSLITAAGDIRPYAASSDPTGFIGTFDGRGFAISNINVGASTAGLLGMLYGATVKDIAFDGIQSNRNDAMPGLLANYSYDTTFENVYIKVAANNGGDNYVSKPYVFGRLSDEFGPNVFTNVIVENTDALKDGNTNKLSRFVFDNDTASVYNNANLIGLPSDFSYKAHATEVGKYVLTLNVSTAAMTAFGVQEGEYALVDCEKAATALAGLIKNLETRFAIDIEYINFAQDTVRGYYVNNAGLAADEAVAKAYTDTGLWTKVGGELVWTSLV